MDYHTNETQARLVTLAELILIGVLTVLALAVFHPGGWRLVASLNACAILFLYRLARGMQRRQMQRRLSEVSSVIRAISEDITTEVRAVEHGHELSRFYSEVENLRTVLAQTEGGRQGMLQVINTIAANIELEQMLAGLMPKVMEETNSLCSAFYLLNPVTNMLEIKHSIGFSKNIYAEFDLSLSEGVIGLAVKERDIQVLRDIPEDTVYIVRTFLGTVKPKSIMVVPVVNQDQLLGVLVLVSLYDYGQTHIESMGLMKYYLGVAVHNGMTYERNKRLTNELKFQNKLIQDLNTDLERKVLDRTMFLNDVIDSIKGYAIYALDTNGVIMAWNTGAESLFGFKQPEVVGKHVDVLHKDSPEHSERLRAGMESALRDGHYTESGWRQKPDGTEYYSEMILFARYNQVNEVVGYTNVIHDITAYKKAMNALSIEKEFSARVMDTSERALLLLDSEGTIIMANKNACEILNSYELTGHSFYNYCKNHAELRKGFKAVQESDATLNLPVVLRTYGRRANVNVSAIKDSDARVRQAFVQITAED